MSEKKRNRLSLSCSLCKKRKVKCDRGKPCSACIKHNCSHLCDYQDVVNWRPDTDSFDIQTRVGGVKQPYTTGVFSSTSLSRDVSSEAVDKNDASKSDSSIMSELDLLKEKLKHIERVVAINRNSPFQPENSASSADSDGFPSFKRTKMDPSPYQDIFLVNQRKGPFDVNGFNPVGSSDDEINFYKNYIPIHMRESRSMNHGPLSWLTMMKKDPALELLWRKISIDKHKGKTFPVEIWLNKREEVRKKHNYEQFKEIMMENEGIADLQPYNRPTGKTMKDTLPLGLSFYGKVESELEFISKMQGILPTKKVIWLSLDRFFVYVYPSMPFIDEESFRQRVTLMLGPRELMDEKIETLRIEKRLDFAELGILLIILRFSYLSLLSNNPNNNERLLNSTDPKDADVRFLLSNPINSDIVNGAQMCLNQFRLLRKSSLPILQCAILMRLYHVLAPEDGDGSDGGDSQIFTGMLIQMANSIGINRDPDNFGQLIKDPKIANIWRKIWYLLMTFDTFQGIMLGNPLTIQDKYFDTKLPFHLPGINDNTRDSRVEACVIEVFGYLMKLKGKVTRMLDVVLDIKNSTKVSVLNGYISELEDFLIHRFKSFSDILTPYDPETQDIYHVLTKINSAKCYMLVRNFLTTLHYYLYLYYEEQGHVELSYYYLKKILVVNAIDMMPNLYLIFNDSEKIFGPGWDLVLTPFMELTLHKSSHVYLSSIVRAKLFMLGAHGSSNKTEFKNDADKVKFDKISKFSRNVIKIADRHVKKIATINDRYYYAWRLSKAHNYILGLIRKDEFYSNQLDNEDVAYLTLPEVTKVNRKNILRHLNIEQLDELNHLCEITMNLNEAKFRFDSVNVERIMALRGSNEVFGTAMAKPKEVATPVDFPMNNSNSGKSVDFVNNEEIDFNWLQMMSSKTALPIRHLSGSGEIRPMEGSVENGAPTPHWNAMNYSFNMDHNMGGLDEFYRDEASPFDIFGEMPIDQLFNLGGLG